MADYTLTGLLASIRRRASIPSTSTTGSADADLLSYINEELQLHMAAQLVSVREEYYLRHSDTALSGTTYRIPTRALGGSLRNVALLDSASKPIFQLSRLSQEKLPEYADKTQTVGYLVEGNNIRLFPSGSWGGASYLRISYFERPSEVVAIGTGARAITVVGTQSVTVSSTTGFTTSTPVDFIRGNAGFETVAIDLVPTNVTSTAVTFAAGVLPSGLAVGDYIALAQTSPVPQLPAEFHPVLAQRVAVRFLAAINDTVQLEVAQRELAKMENSIGILTAPRVEGGPRKIYQANGALSGARFRIRGGIGVL